MQIYFSAQIYFFNIFFLFLSFRILQYVNRFNISLNSRELTNLHHMKIINIRNVWEICVRCCDIFIAFYYNRLWMHALMVNENCYSPEEKVQKVINNSKKYDTPWFMFLFLIGTKFTDSVETSLCSYILLLNRCVYIK